MSSCTLPATFTDQTNTTCLYTLTRGDSIGLALTAEAGFISFFAVVGLFALIVRKYVRKLKLIQYPTDIYMLSLFTFDLIQALGGLLDVKWVNEGTVYTGSYCTAQGVIQQLGETGVALATLAIAIHTFVVVIWGKLKKSMFVAYSIVGLIWLFVVLFVAITVGIHTKGSEHYETPTPYWCWIGAGHKAERIAGEYFWLWFTLCISLLVYLTLFFWTRGNISVSKEQWWKIQVHKRKATMNIDPNGRRRSYGMIAYPIVYCILVLPLSIVRWISGFGTKTNAIPAVATFVVIFIYSLSGALNALLFLSTRSDLLLLGSSSSRKNGNALARGVKLAESGTSLDTESARVSSAPEHRETVQHQAPLGLLPTMNDGGWEPEVEQKEPGARR